MIALDPPRWKSGPLICPGANLPALESEASLHEFHKANAPSCSVVYEWKCDHCGMYHAHTVAADPSGQSSGTGRSHKNS